MCVNGLYELQHPAAGQAVSQLWSTNAFRLVAAVLIFHALIAAAGPFSDEKVRLHRVAEIAAAQLRAACLADPHHRGRRLIPGHSLDNTGIR